MEKMSSLVCYCCRLLIKLVSPDQVLKGFINALRGEGGVSVDLNHTFHPDTAANNLYVSKCHPV